MEIILDGVASRVRRERETTAWLAWHIDALRRAERLPPLRQLMPVRKKRKAAAPAQDAWKTQYAAFAAWAQSFRKDHHE